jgi:ribonuclease HI
MSTSTRPVIAAISVAAHPHRGAGGWAYLTDQGAHTSHWSATADQLALQLEALDAALAHAGRRGLHVTLPDTRLIRALQSPSTAPSHLRARAHAVAAKLTPSVRFRPVAPKSMQAEARRLARAAANAGTTQHWDGAPINAEIVVVATDGSYNPETGVGGWAWWVDEQTQASGAVHGGGSSHRMEVEAILEALGAIDPSSSTLVLTDSLTLVDAVQRILAGDEMRAASSWDAPLHQLVNMIRKRTVRLQWVKAHAGQEGNSAADRAARAAVRQLSRAA